MAEIATVILVSLAGISDLRTGKIYNAITYSAIGWAVVASAAGALDPALSHLGVPWRSAAIGFGVAFVGFFFLYALGWMGGGDVKLMAAVGALKGFPFILHAMFYSIFLGGIAALLVLIWRGELAATTREAGRALREVVVPGTSPAPMKKLGGSLPFGVAICFGTMAAMALEVFQLRVL